MNIKNLFEAAYACLLENNIEQKCILTKNLYDDLLQNKLELQSKAIAVDIKIPGLPPALQLVKPQELTQRSVHSSDGHAALIHSICHIEFNAINLALDALYRFRDLPRDYYIDWAKVASEEAYHFSMLHKHLKSLGFEYGDFKAHNGLWRMVLDTTHDPLVRMALVPRVLEARGLDVTPNILKKLQYIKDDNAISILEIIFNDEIGHVAIGTKWFHYLCEKRGIDKEKTFFELMDKYLKGKIHGPFHTEARKKAGFTESELQYLTSL